MIEIFILFVGIGIALRFNSHWERRLLARRRLHALVHPLNHYLTLLDHELQNAHHHPDPLASQAVLDHVTELRSFLIRPDSYDLNIWGYPKWVPNLNSTLLRLEENLEIALQGEWDERSENVKKDVKNLLSDFQSLMDLKKLTETRVGLVEP